jgi:hypothetical protein
MNEHGFVIIFYECKNDTYVHKVFDLIFKIVFVLKVL